MPGNSANSVIYKRMLNQSVLEGAVPLLHMPLHTPGLDCDAVQLVGQWITSLPATGTSTPAEIAAALEAAAAFRTSCTPAADVQWLEEDFSSPAVYAPRRADWNDPVTGFPDSVRGTLAAFQVGDRNFAGNYLIWMAMGATQAFFPPELESLIGSNGPNMLNQVRQSCAQLLPGIDTPLLPAYQVYETYQAVCTFENPITPDAGFQPGTRTPLDPATQKAWLDHAAQNAGWMIFQFLHEELTAGHRPIARDQCELVFPAQ